MDNKKIHLSRTLGTWDVMVAGIALVVAASTMVTDFAGFFTLGWGFVVALVIAGAINMLLAMSAADLSVRYPKAGALYEYSKDLFSGRLGALISVFVALCFFIMISFGISGEIAAGGHALKALFHSDIGVHYFVGIIVVLAVVPNLLGVKEAAWVSALLLIFMLGIRWFFGLAGFLGWGEFGEWSSANMVPEGGVPGLFGDGGIIIVGLGLAIWSFVGIEFGCALAEEVKNPAKSMPMGLMLGILIILATSIMMGVGVTGTAPLEFWQTLAASEAACSGDCPQLAIGQHAFGATGFTLMAIASAAATLGTATVAIAALSRLLFSIARDGLLFGETISTSFAYLNPKSHTPTAGILLTAVFLTVPSMTSSSVIELVFSGAYVWVISYVIFHVYSLLARYRNDGSVPAFGDWYKGFAVIGAISTIVAIYYAFLGGHSIYGVKALIMACVSFAIAVISVVMAERRKPEVEEALQENVVN
ncbi:APC family permease [Neptunomonas japonica]|uniref:APC family permease n=1 Tax=Neptunomonas japonica TaxID=417574 RepID=UPI000415B2A6|nr:APC family permease [Neptunomonas japonica]